MKFYTICRLRENVTFFLFCCFLNSRIMELGFKEGEHMGNMAITQNTIALQTKQLLRTKPIDKISVTTICENSGIDRKTFYRYFKDKYDVIDWIYYHDFFEDMAPQPEWNIWDYFSEITRQFYTDREFYANAFRYKGQNSFRDYGTELLLPIIHEEYGDLFQTPEEEHFFVCHALEWSYDACENWLNQKPCPTPEEFARNFKDLFSKFSERSAELIRDSFQRNQ